MSPSRSEPLIDNLVDRSNLKIVALASPADGHTFPLLRIVEELVLRGYDVTFLASEDYRARTAAVGAYFVPVPPYDDIQRITTELSVIADPGERMNAAMIELFITPTAGRMATLYAALEDVKREKPLHKVVLLTESFFLGDHPLFLGAPLPKGFTRRPRAINIHACSYGLSSVDSAPFGLTIIPDGTAESREKYRKLHSDMLTGSLAESVALQKKVLTELGATNMDEVEGRNPLDVIATTADVTLQMCPPSLEYRRSDIHPKVRFIGALPPRAPPKTFSAPPFWNTVINGSKRVVVVSQGTVAVRYDQLLVPAMHALADRDDIVVVAILGQKGAELPGEVAIPSNAYTVDYLSYDAMLPYASVFVLNAGYGGFMHGIVNGVPMVLAGGSEDKPEVANRGEFAGVGINLRTGTPSQRQIRQGVDEILSNPKYKRRVKEIQLENEKMKAMDSVEKEILKWAAMD
ncbi:UDP-glucosyltransferase [Beauveria bassiana ARSEF 2860]|uniref:UDP-glucosyltransferase 1 n=1 Tax=Beauveria bassiana (strain ARSEF 2860) TaxID=655819 RepID=GT1_BEAB2|nr:UDP-glucosyltransferase [Beauveria bassiana ARSEF 2860]J4VV61.1 RecName: Full=UDP-glucosyltransferase 1; Short=GT1 [Beauveria bassiana ARSEF 2860]EJP62360.1 UDP-glucosyltransferase [Beauveria bassiana ARSEF 2860]